jgi:hypothetical protein
VQHHLKILKELLNLKIKKNSKCWSNKIKSLANYRQEESSGTSAAFLVESIGNARQEEKQHRK